MTISVGKSNLFEEYYMLPQQHLWYLSYQMFLSVHSVSMFVKDEMAPFDSLKTLYDFIEFVDKICVLGLQVAC